ncbi:MAG TPA: hypothetical protein PLI57_09230, partial [Spirochaetota bacterium]|nr:hypothetical protein [Spirochaetota bacterium]
ASNQSRICVNLFSAPYASNFYATIVARYRGVTRRICVKKDFYLKKGEVMAIKCPSCGGKMIFNVPNQGLKCRNCDNETQVDY